MSEGINWGGKLVIPEPLGRWLWIKPKKVRNKGGGMKKRRGRRYKGYNSHREIPAYHVATFELGEKFVRSELGFVFRYSRDRIENPAPWKTMPRCYDYPPSKHYSRL